MWMKGEDITDACEGRLEVSEKLGQARGKGTSYCRRGRRQVSEGRGNVTYIQAVHHLGIG